MRVIEANEEKVDGIKISLLDDQKEVVMRRRLPAGVKMYTGDDFNYPELIAGDDQGFSHALLGIFDPIAPAASLALEKLAAGDRAGFDTIACADRAAVAPDLPGADAILQDRRRLPRLAQRTSRIISSWRAARSRCGRFTYFAEIFRLADQAGLLAIPIARGSPHARSPGALRRRQLMRDLKGRPDLCAINTATLGLPGADRRRHRGDRAAWLRRHRALAARGRREGCQRRSASRIRDAGSRSPAIAAAPSFRRRRARISAPMSKRTSSAISDAAAIWRQLLVMVVGGLPQGSKDIAGARAQVAEGTAELLAHAKPLGVRIALEPLHPVYAADRSCLSTIDEARRSCGTARVAEGHAGRLPRCLSHLVGSLPSRAPSHAPKGRITGFHVCDWLVPMKDVLNDRGMMGDGVIDIPSIRAMVEDAGYGGLIEVEIFSTANWWKRPMDETLTVCQERLASVC